MQFGSQKYFQRLATSNNAKARNTTKYCHSNLYQISRSCWQYYFNSHGCLSSLIDNQKFSQGKKNKAYDRVAKQIDELVDTQKHMETLEKHIQLD